MCMYRQLYQVWGMRRRRHKKGPVGAEPPGRALYTDDGQHETTPAGGCDPHTPCIGSKGPYGIYVGYMYI